MSKGSVWQETLIRLGTEIDNEGVQKLFSLLDSSKLKALGLTAAISGVTTAIYKMIESATKKEFEFEKLAKQQKKTVNLVRAENSAMQAMGKTMAEIKKDDNLKKMYNDIVKFNKEIAFPNMEQSLRKINNLQGAFYKFKSALGYTVQWMNAQILANLEAPIDRLTNKLNKGSSWLRDNMPIIASKVGLFISDFAKGIFGIVEGVGKVAEFFNSLPDAIKQAGIAIAAALAIFETGPIGQILALITLVGDIMHDYDNYHWNKENAAKKDTDPTKFFAKKGGGYTQKKNEAEVDAEGKPIAYQVDLGLEGVWDILDSEAGNTEKAKQIATTVITTLTEALKEGFRDFKMSDIFGDGSGDGEGLIGGILSWFREDQNQQALENFGKEFLGWCGRGIRTIGGTAGGIIAEIFGAVFGEGFGSDNEILNDMDGSKATALASAFGGFFGSFFEKIKSGGSIQEAFLNGIQGGGIGAIIGAILGNITDEEGNFRIDETTLGGAMEDLGTVGQFVWEVIAKGLDTVGNIGQMLFEYIGNKIKESVGDNSLFSPIGEAFEILGEEGSPLGQILSTAIAGWGATGSFGAGILTGIGDAIRICLDDPSSAQRLIDDITAFADEFAKFFDMIWNGVADENGNRGPGLGKFFEKMWQGENGEGGIKGFFASIANDIVGWLDPIKEAMITWFDGLWIELYNHMPPWLSKALGDLGLIENPNKTSVTQDENGGYYLENTDHTKTQIPKEAADILSLMSGSIQSDGNGGFTLTGPLANSKNGNFYQELLAGLINGDEYYLGTLGNKENRQALINGIRPYVSDEAYKAYLDKTNPIVRPHNVKPKEGQIDGGNIAQSGGAEVQLLPDDDPILQLLNEKNYSADVEPDVDTESIDEQLHSRTYSIDVRGNVNDVVKEEAWGGRIGSRMDNVTVGEDGTEYIIPITKPGRAKSLINQMLNEMGMSALSGLQSMGFGGSGTIGGGSMESILGSIGAGNTNVSASVNIYVNATGSDGKEIGEGAYDAAERHLMKTLRGVYA